MYSCLRQSFSFPKNLFIYKRNSSSKFFSLISSVPDEPSSNYYANNIFFTKSCKPKQMHCRYFSLNNASVTPEYLKEPVKVVTQALIETHDVIGLPWSFTIIAASAVLKLFVSFPCGVYQQYLVSKLDLVKTELQKASKTLGEALQKKGNRHQWTYEKFQSEFRKESRKMRKHLFVKHNCHPFKITILFLIQFPFWLLLTISIRKLAMDIYSKNIENPMTALQFQVGGLFWCPNLSVPDPTLILPSVNLLSMLTVSELANLVRVKEEYYKSFLGNKILPNFFRAFSVCFFFISAASPAGVSLFWVTTSIITLGQNLLLLSPRMRRILKIPKTASEVDKPYSYAFNNLAEKLRKVSIWKK